MTSLPAMTLLPGIGVQFHWLPGVPFTLDLPLDTILYQIGLHLPINRFLSFRLKSDIYILMD